MRSLSPEEIRRELIMMRDVSAWPQWPFLPVKKSQERGFPICGVVVCDTHGKSSPVIYDYNIFDQKEFDFDKKIATYNSFEEMVADGWVVD